MSKETITHPGTPVDHILCTSCGTNSIIRIPYYWITEDGVTCAPSKLVCMQCGRKFDVLREDLTRGSN